MSIKDDLIKIGLSESQSKVYAWLLVNHESNIVQIARGTGYTRQSIYSIIDQLREKRLLIENQGRRITYSAQSPSHLFNLIKREEQEFEKKQEEKKQLLKDSISKMIYYRDKKNDKAKVRFFEGEVGIEEIRNEILEEHANEDSFEVFNYDSIPKGKKDIEHRKKVKRNPKRVNCLCSTRSKKLLGRKIQDGLITYNIKDIFQNEVFPGEILIYKRKVVLISPGEGRYKDVFGIIIQDRKIAETLRLLVKTMLKNA